MRIERNENHRAYRCWLRPDGYKTLKQSAMSYRDFLIADLGDEVGLDSFEIPQIHPEHIKHVDGHARIRVPQGKDTEGSGVKPRDVSLPEQVESELLRYANVEGVDHHESIIDLNECAVQRRV
jgi:hypothetical protein